MDEGAFGIDTPTKRVGFSRLSGFLSSGVDWIADPEFPNPKVGPVHTVVANVPDS